MCVKSAVKHEKLVLTWNYVSEYHNYILTENIGSHKGQGDLT